MNDDSHFMRSLSVEMASEGRGYYSERTLEIAETIERLRARERMLRGMAANDGNPDQNVARRALALMDNTTELFRRIDEQETRR